MSFIWWVCYRVWNRDDYLAPIPEDERGDLVLAYHARLNSADDEVRKNAARAWSLWECVPDHMARKRIADPLILQDGYFEVIRRPGLPGGSGKR